MSGQPPNRPGHQPPQRGYLPPGPPPTSAPGARNGGGRPDGPPWQNPAYVGPRPWAPHAVLPGGQPLPRGPQHSPAPRGSKTWLIVTIAIVALVLIVGTALGMVLLSRGHIKGGRLPESFHGYRTMIRDNGPKSARPGYRDFYADYMTSDWLGDEFSVSVSEGTSDVKAYAKTLHSQKPYDLGVCGIDAESNYRQCVLTQKNVVLQMSFGTSGEPNYELAKEYLDAIT